jgi:hypothetical protein
MKPYLLSFAMLLLLSFRLHASQPQTTEYFISDIDCAEAHGISVFVGFGAQLIKTENPQGSARIYLPIATDPELRYVMFLFEDEKQLFSTEIQELRSSKSREFRANGTEDIILNGRFQIAFKDQTYYNLNLRDIYRSIIERGFPSDGVTSLGRKSASLVESLERCGIPGPW